MRLPGRDAEKMGIKPKDIRDELGRAIDRYAKNDDHAQRSIDSLMAEMRFRPTEADIRQFCAGTVPVIEGDYQTRPKCKDCDGNGFLTVYKLVTFKGASSTVESSETITNCRNQEQFLEYGRQLKAKLAANPQSARQIVQSAAKPCHCRAVTA